MNKSSVSRIYPEHAMDNNASSSSHCLEVYWAILPPMSMCDMSRWMDMQAIKLNNRTKQNKNTANKDGVLGLG